ncbi:MAG TPA: lipocalin-like domain-containing protein [Candidatus Acidoferrum sp.]|nr:lipocalin-like domain-containing protein [Candidatus Acidoferrum sp.]
MKSRLACFVAALLLLQPLAAQYRTALPGYRYEFPRDHFNHPDFQTEWWYYTGNLKSPDGHRFGFELTFFRQAVSRDPAKAAAWEVQDLYLAHLALSDLDGGKFYHSERTNRAGPGIAAVSESLGRIWNGNWQIQWHGNDQELSAVDERFQLHLTLHPEKLPVIHGENGVSQKAEGPGRASHYVSLTCLATSGAIDLGSKTFEVRGTSWMDHEFFTHQLESSQTGWDWLSLQLEDHTEVMLFHIRRKDGSIDPYSAGTYVDAEGKTTHLRSSDFKLQPVGEKWRSAVTSAEYPIHWKIAIPKLGLELEVKTPLASQELTGKTKLAPNYWEGAILLTGHRNAQSLSGAGYLEMTGYDRPVQLAP